MSQTLNTPFYRATWHLAEGRKFKLPLVRKEEEEDRNLTKQKYGCFVDSQRKNVIESFLYGTPLIVYKQS